MTPLMLVMAERRRQIKLWGENEFNTSSHWLKVLNHQIDEAEIADTFKDTLQWQRRLVQTAAVALSALEQLQKQTPP